MRDEFLAVVSHELRTPLTTVLGWSRLLREDASDPVRLGRGLEVIERSAASQSRIIDDLVDPRLPPQWSRLEIPVTFRGRRLRVSVRHDSMCARVPRAEEHARWPTTSYPASKA